MKKNRKMNVLELELLNFLRDKTSWVIVILLPLIIFPILILGSMNMCENSRTTPVTKEICVAFSRPPEGELLDAINAVKGEYKINIVNVANYRKELSTGEIEAYFYIGKEEEQPFYRIYADEYNSESINAIRCLENIVLDYNNRIMSDMGIGEENKPQLRRYEFEQVNSKYILTSVAKDIIGATITNALPYIIILIATISCMYAAMKTRVSKDDTGNMEAILSTGVTTTKYINDKYLVVASVGVINTLISIVAIFISGAMVYFLDKTLVSSLIQQVEMKYGLIYICIILVYIVTTMIIIAMGVAAISVYIFSAMKWYKSIINIIFIMGAIIALSRQIYRNIYLLQGITKFEEFLEPLSGKIIYLGAVVIIITYITLRLLDRDRVLFGISKRKSVLEIRNSISKGGVPTPIQALLLFAISNIIGEWIDFKLSIQALDIIVMIVLICCFKLSIKYTYGFKKPKLKHVIGAIFIYLGANVASDICGLFMHGLFRDYLKESQPYVAETIKESKTIFHLLYVSAIVPGVAEELTYRGFLISGLRNNEKQERIKNMLLPIMLSSVLFGLIHEDVRLVPGCIIFGIGMGYIYYRSNCIYIGIVLHVFHNAMNSICSVYTNNPFCISYSRLYIQLSHMNIINITIILASIIIGVILLKPSRKLEANGSSKDRDKNIVEATAK